jgi:hypothetical protein
MSRSDRLAMLTFVVLFGGTFIWFLEITMKGQFVIDFETTVTVPFLHSEEDVDEKIRVQFELLTDSVADSGAGMSISDMSITAAHRVDV